MPPVETRLTVEVEHETDGRWIAEVTDLPGVVAYGSSKQQALAAVQSLALRVLADRLDNGEYTPLPTTITFVAA